MNDGFGVGENVAVEVTRAGSNNGLYYALIILAILIIIYLVLRGRDKQ